MDLRIVCLSDHHHQYENLVIPHGDIFIHAGDFTRRGILEELAVFNAFLGQLPHRYKIVTPGNHDFCCQEQDAASRAILTNGYYLVDEEVTIEGLKFYGSPWQPRFWNFAFNLDRGEPLRAKWDLIPADTDVLITHGPPIGYGDRTAGGHHVGCADLRDAVERIRPRLHVFGHIHEGAGVFKAGETTFINASVFNRHKNQERRATVFLWKQNTDVRIGEQSG